MDAGSLSFKIELDRQSLARSLAQVERAFAQQIVDVGIQVDRQSIGRATAQIERAFDRQVVNVGIQADRQSLERTSSQIDAAFRDQRINIGVDVDRSKLDASKFKDAGASGGRSFNTGFAGSVAIGNIVADAAQAAVRAIVDAFRGAAGIIGNASSEFRDFELATAQFAAKAGNTLPDQLDRIADASKNIASETSFAPAEVQRLGTQLLALGATSDDVERDLGAIAKAAQALGESADITGRTIQGFTASYERLGLSASETSDLLVQAVNTTGIGSRSGIAEFDQLASKAATTAATLGIEAEQLISAFAALRGVNTGVELSAGALQRTLLTLATRRDQLNAEGIELGFNDDGGVDLEVTLRNIAARVEGLGNTERIDLLAQLFDRRSAGTINTLIEQIDTGYTRAYENLGNAAGTTEEQVARLNATLEGQRALIQGNVQSLQTGFGEAFAPLEAALTGVVSGIVAGLTDADLGLSDLSAAAERFAGVLEGSPEITERIADAFVSLAQDGVEALTGIVDGLTAFAANDQAVENLAQSIEEVGAAFQLAGRFVQGLIGATEIFFTLGTAAENTGSSIRFALDASPAGPIIAALERVLGVVQRISEELGLLEAESATGLEGASAVVDNAASEINGALARANAQISANAIEVPPPAVGEGGTENLAETTEEIAAAQKAALDNLTSEIDSALSKIETLQSQRLASIKQAQLDGLITEEEAQSQIADVAAETTDKIIAEKQRELSEVQNLKAAGTITEEQAAEQITALQKEIADTTLQRIDQEIAAQERARQAALEKFDAELERAKQLDEINSIENDIATTALSAQQDLLSAQESLAASKRELIDTELQGALAQAEAADDVLAADQIRQQIARNNIAAADEEQQFKQRQLDLTIQQNQLEAQRRIQVAEIAAIEADIAVQKARAEGATDAEIDGLERIRDLRQEQVDQARDAAANQDQINSALQEQLTVEGDIARQQAIQSANTDDLIKKQKELKDERTKLEEELAQNQASAQSALAGAFTATGETESERIGSIEDQFRNATSAGLFDNVDTGEFTGALRDLERALGSGDDRGILRAAQSSGDQDLFAQLLGQVGRGDLASLVSADAEIDRLKEAQEPIVAELQLLNDRIAALANSPRALTVQTPDPVADTGRIVGEIQRNRYRGVNA